MSPRQHEPKDYLPFHKAREEVHKLGVQNWREWWSLAKSGQLPAGIPSDPSKVYVEFTNWSDFLGTKHKPRKNEYASIEVAMKYARDRGIKNQAEWTAHCKEEGKKGTLPKFIPTDLRRTYGEEFKKIGGMRGFLGRATMPYTEALRYAREMKFSGIRDFERWATSDDRPANFPRHPHLTYKDRFVSYRHFLGLPMNRRESERKLQELVDVIESDKTLKKMLSQSDKPKLTITDLSDMLDHSDLKESRNKIISSVREIKKAGHHKPLEAIQDLV